jgi:phosphoadenosine phosphosulfate reductase
MLVSCERIKKNDLLVWKSLESADMLSYDDKKFSLMVNKSMADIRSFSSSKSFYVGTSWGKDSVVLMYLCLKAKIDCVFVWVRVDGCYNPDCLCVRDAFFSRFGNLNYDEIIIPFNGKKEGRLSEGFMRAKKKYGGRYISGVRADESGVRKISMRTHGIYNANVCRPIGWWKTSEIFSFMAYNFLPVHPVYAMLGGGRWDRSRLRVASIGGARGDQFGRGIWEKEYYPDVLRKIEAHVNY